MSYLYGHKDMRTIVNAMSRSIRNYYMRKFLIAIAALAFLSGCKPSEKNYRLAYETAQQRAREGLDEGVYEQMQQEMLPPMVRVLGDSVRVQRLPLAVYYVPAQPDTASMKMPGAYNVAVAKYKMPTNARSHAESLVAEGYAAAVLKSGTSLYYVMAGLTESLDSAARLARRYDAVHKCMYIGIPCPIAIQPVR